MMVKEGGDELATWKLALIRADAPALKRASLLVVADCVPMVYPELYKDLWIQNRVSLSSCPEIEEPRKIADKTTEIAHQSKIKDLKVVAMPRPCCFLLHYSIDEALSRIDESIPVSHLVVVEGETRELGRDAVKKRLFIRFPVKDQSLYEPRPWPRRIA